MKIDAVIFDLDGTLWDSCRVVAESWQRTLHDSYGSEVNIDEEDVRSIMGLRKADIAQKLFSSFSEQAIEVCTHCISEEDAYIREHSGDVYAGVEDMLCSLAMNRELFIVSNCQDGYIQCFLACTGFAPYIRDFTSEGASGMGKADNIRAIVKKHGLQNPVYLGDTHLDEQSAREAGCRFVHASYGFGTALSPDAVINSPSELEAVLIKLEDNSNV